MSEFRFVTKEPVNKGWSGDRKYCVTAEDGTKYLLRVTPEAKSRGRENMYRLQKEIEALGVPMCRPVEFGKCEEGVYSLQTWIDGADAEEAVPQMEGDRQYALGEEAGVILKKIHSLPVPEGRQDWEARFNAKTDRKVRMYMECPVKYEGGEAFIDYVMNNRNLLKNRPQCYQHGDYHIGNMMIEDGKIVIIDFDRSDVGDPWEEFNRIVWTAQASPLFASGLVDGYFAGEVPMDFWRLLAFYISSNALSSLPWAIPFGDREVKTMLDQGREILEWYDGMQKVVPSWYSRE